VSVCVCLCLSVTLWYYIKMAKCRIMQIMPHDSQGSSFLVPKIMAKFEWEQPIQGHQMQVGMLKSLTFDK